jgi:hypothetical protein
MEVSKEGTFRVRKGAWTEEEDILLRHCIQKHGEGNWYRVPSIAGNLFSFFCFFQESDQTRLINFMGFFGKLVQE